MRFVESEILPPARTFDIDKVTHAVPQPHGGLRLMLDAQQLDLPHTLRYSEDVLPRARAW